MASYKQQTGKTIEEAFKKFDEANPKIYELFRGQVLRAVKRGKKKLSSKAIINYIRWEVYINTDSDDGYKINDAFTAMYARKYRHDFPWNKDLFEFRQRKSMDLSGTIKENDYLNIINTVNKDKNDVTIKLNVDATPTKSGQSNLNFK